MTNLHLPDTRPALRSRRQTAAVRASGFALGLALLAPWSAVAQAPASAPPPPKPAVVQAPPRVAPPPVASPPPAGRRAAPVTAVRQPAATTLRTAPAPVGLPLDSIRPKAAVSSAPPANAVALCKDGTYIVAPADASACGNHRGLQVAMPQRAAPPPAVSHVAAPAAAVRANPAATATTPPAGATMRCKDGTWLNGTRAAGACAGHAGLAMTVPLRGPAPRPLGVTSPPRPAPKGTVQPAVTPATTQPPARPAATAKPAARPAPAKPATPPNNP